MVLEHILESTVYSAAMLNLSLSKDKANNYFKKLQELHEMIVDSSSIEDYFYYEMMAVLACLYQEAKVLITNKQNNPDNFSTLEIAVLIKEIEKIDNNLNLLANHINELPQANYMHIDLTEDISKLQDRNTSLETFTKIVNKYWEHKVVDYNEPATTVDPINQQTRDMQKIFEHLIADHPFKVDCSVSDSIKIILLRPDMESIQYTFNSEDLSKIQYHFLKINEPLDIEAYLNSLIANNYIARFEFGNYVCNALNPELEKKDPNYLRERAKRKGLDYLKLDAQSKDLNDLRFDFNELIDQVTYIQDENDKNTYKNLHLGFSLALNRYTRDEYYKNINQFLRGNLNVITSPAQLKSTILDIVFINKALEKLPKYKGVLYRGEGKVSKGFKQNSLPSITNSSVSGSKPITWQAFLSASRDRATKGFVSDTVQILFTDGKAGGVMISPFSLYGDSEKEIVFPPGTQLKPQLLAIKGNNVVAVQEAIPAYAKFMKDFAKEITANYIHDPVKIFMVNSRIKKISK